MAAEEERTARGEELQQQRRGSQDSCSLQQQQQQQHPKAPSPQQPLPVIRPQPLMVLRAVAAAAVCAAAILYASLLFNRSQLFWWTTAAAELAFCVYYHCVNVPYFTNLAHRQGPQEHDALFIKQRLLEQLMRVDDVMACMESWFLEAAPGEVQKDNLKELFAYAIWYKSLGEMEAEGTLPELDDLMAQLEAKYGRRLPQGYNPNLRFMSHLWEPLRHMYRPLMFYLAMELLTLLCHLALLATGFRLRQIDGITYYTYRVGQQKLVSAISAPMKRCCSSWSVSSAATCGSSAAGSTRGSLLASAASHNALAAANGTATGAGIGSSGSSSGSADAASMPIVFLHGVGAGLLPYLTIIFRLAALGRPMILPHSKHVSMRLVSWIPTVDDMADATAAMLAAHGYGRAAVIAHSYGTMVASRLVIKYPQLVHSMCLTDPVCFAMFMPNLLRSFLYARHSSGCWWQDMLLRLVASELHVCANFSRKFFWSSINLWDEHIPERTLVVLGGKDILSPTDHVDRWLREHTHAQVMYEPGMRHAGMLLSMSWQAAIVAAFANIMQRPDLADDPAPPASTAAAAAAAATATAPPPAAAGGSAGEPAAVAEEAVTAALCGSTVAGAAGGGLVSLAADVSAAPDATAFVTAVSAGAAAAAVGTGLRSDWTKAALRKQVSGSMAAAGAAVAADGVSADVSAAPDAPATSTAISASTSAAAAAPAAARAGLRSDSTRPHAKPKRSLGADALAALPLRPCVLRLPGDLPPGALGFNSKQHPSVPQQQQQQQEEDGNGTDGSSSPDAPTALPGAAQLGL